MGAGVKYYLPGANEIPPLLLLPYLHDQVEQVLGLLQPLGIRFLVQRSVMSSFLAIMQKTEPGVVRVRCVFGVRSEPALARCGGVGNRVPVAVWACSRVPPACGTASVRSTFTQYANDIKTSGYSKSWTVPGAEFDWGGTSPKQ